MAAAALNLVFWLQLILSLSTKIPKGIELLNLLYELFREEIERALGGTATGGADDGLQLVALSTEEEQLVEQITQRLTEQTGSQQMLDIAKIRRLVKFLAVAANSEEAKAVIAILRRLASGG